jgi:hypothetical protein
MKSGVNYFIALALIYSCNGAKENSDKTLVKQKENSGFVNFLKLIPIAKEPFYFDADSSENLDFRTCPDSLIDKMGQDSMSYWGGKAYFPNINLSRKRHYKYSDEKIEFKFYRRLPFDSAHYDILVAIEEPPSNKWWQILTFEMDGKEVSLVEGIYGIHLQNGRLVTWWLYASNERPDFATWIRNNGRFEKTSEKQEVPVQ